MFEFLARKRKKQEKIEEKKPSSMAFDYGVEDKVGEFISYPPFFDGLPVRSVNDIVAAQNVLIQKIRISLGLTQSAFNDLVIPLIVNYAGHVHLLPASENHHHRGSAGLFRHGLEVAFWSAQASEAYLFGVDGSPSERRTKEPAWRLAAFIAGLLHDAAKPMTDVIVTSDRTDRPWNSQTETIVEWAERYNISDYHIHWRQTRHQKHEKFVLAAAKQLITRQIFTYLQEADPKLVESLFDTITRSNITQPLTQIIQKADEQSVINDIKTNTNKNASYEYAVPVEIFVTDALRVLVNTNRWTVNQLGSKVWYCNDGVFIVWRGIEDLYTIIDRDGRKGVPRDPDMLADILIDRNFAVENNRSYKGQVGVYRYWEITPDVLSELTHGKPVSLTVLRVADPSSIFTTQIPKQVKAKISGSDVTNYKFPQLPDGKGSGSESETETETGTDKGLDDGKAETTSHASDGGDSVMDITFPFDLGEPEEPEAAAATTQEAVRKKPESKQAPKPDNKSKPLTNDSLCELTGSSNKPTNPKSVHGTETKAPNKKPKRTSISKSVKKPEPKTKEPVEKKGTDKSDVIAKNLAIFTKEISTYANKELLETILKPYVAKEKKIGKGLHQKNSHIAMKYPSDLVAYGEAKDVIGVLSKNGALIGVDGIKTRLIHSDGSGKHILLNKKLSKCILNLVSEAIKQDLNKKGVKAVSNSEKTKQQPTNNVKLRKKPINKSEQDSESRLSEAVMPRKYTSKSENKTKPDTPKKSVPNKKIPIIKEGHTSLVSVSDGSNIQSLSVREAVVVFRDMIIAGEGEFISGSVTHKDNYLIVSIKSLKIIESLCPRVNRTVFEVACMKSGFVIEGECIKLRGDL